MLDARESNEVLPLLNGYTQDPSRGKAALDRYFAITGFRETNPNALWHHVLSLYGPPCEACGKPLRTPAANWCAACGTHVSKAFEGIGPEEQWPDLLCFKGKMGSEKYEDIIEAYGEYIANSPPSPIELHDTKQLLHSKADILAACCRAIIETKNQELLAALRIGVMLLPYFQHGVGDRPVRLSGLSPKDASSLNILEYAERLADDANIERYKAYDPLISRDKAHIEEMLKLATKLKQVANEPSSRGHASIFSMVSAIYTRLTARFLAR